MQEQDAGPAPRSDWLSTSNVLNFGSLILLGWVVAFGQPYQPVFIALAALPPLAIRWMHVTGNGTRYGVYGSLWLMFIVAPVTMSLLSATRCSIEFVDLLPAALFAGIATLTLIKLFPQMRQHPGSVAGVTALAALYGLGLWTFANIELDRSRGQTTRTTSVREILLSRSLGSWERPQYRAEFDGVGDIAITREAYWAVRDGATYCATVRRGAFGMEWIEGQLCR